MKNSFLLAVLTISSMVLGSLITVTYVKWITPAPRPVSPCEYQFIVTDDSVEVFDSNRFVGKIELEAQLDSLITLDNQ
jgi:hypothetical protein